MVSTHESPERLINVIGFQLLEFPVQQISGKPKIVYYQTSSRVALIVLVWASSFKRRDSLV